MRTREKRIPHQPHLRQDYPLQEVPPIQRTSHRKPAQGTRRLHGTHSSRTQVARRQPPDRSTAKRHSTLSGSSENQERTHARQHPLCTLPVPGTHSTIRHPPAITGRHTTEEPRQPANRDTRPHTSTSRQRQPIWRRRRLLNSCMDNTGKDIHPCE